MVAKLQPQSGIEPHPIQSRFVVMFTATATAAAAESTEERQDLLRLTAKPPRLTLFSS